MHLERREIVQIELADFFQDGRFGRSKKRELFIEFLFFARRFRLELQEHFLCPFNGLRRETCEFSDMDPIAFIRASADDFPEKNNA